MRKTLVGVLIALFGPVAALVLGHVMSTAPEWIWQGAGVLCAIVGTLIVSLVDPAHAWLLRMRRRFSLPIRVAACVLAGWITYVALNAAAGADVPLPATALLVDYDQRMIVIEVGPPRQVYMLQLSPRNEAGLISTAMSFDTVPGDQRWLRHCIVTNKGDATLLDINLVFDVTFFEGDLTDSLATLKRRMHVKWPALASNESFDFYFVNASRQGIRVDPVREAWGKVFGREKTQRLSIVPGTGARTSLVLPKPGE